MEASVDPYPRGPVWMPITPKTGSLFHADSYFRRTSSWKDVGGRFVGAFFATAPRYIPSNVSAKSANVTDKSKEDFKDSLPNSESWIVGPAAGIHRYKNAESGIIRVSNRPRRPRLEFSV